MRWRSVMRLGSWCSNGRSGSRAASPATEEAGRDDGSRRPGRLHGGEHGLDVPRHLDATPCLGDDAVRVDEERAALDADDLAAVERLFADHVECIAQGLVRIAGQFELQALL